MPVPKSQRVVTTRMVVLKVLGGQVDRALIERMAPAWGWSSYEFLVVRKNVILVAALGLLLAESDRERRRFRDLVAEFQGLGDTTP